MSSETSDQRPYLGAMMRVSWQWVWKRIVSGVVAAGYDDLNPAHVGLFRYPSLDGQRPSELADQLQITKQSVNDLLGHLEQTGYLTRGPDPADGRARVVRLTPKGQRLETTIREWALAADQEISELLGARRYTQLCDALEELSRHVTSNGTSSITTK